MPTDRISPSTSLLETVRAMARDRAKRAGTGTATPRTAAGGADEVSTPNTTRAIGELRQRLRELASTVDVGDVQSVRDVRVPALREILLWEFGRDFRKDAQFLPMVDAIAQHLDADPDFARRFAELVAGLQK